MYVDLFVAQEYTQGWHSFNAASDTRSCLASRELRGRVQLLFNNQQEGFIEALEAEVNRTDGVSGLRYKPAFEKPGDR